MSESQLLRRDLSGCRRWRLDVRVPISTQAALAPLDVAPSQRHEVTARLRRAPTPPGPWPPRSHRAHRRGLGARRERIGEHRHGRVRRWLGARLSPVPTVARAIASVAPPAARSSLPSTAEYATKL